MYGIAGLLPVDELPGGVVQVSGPAMAGKHDLVVRLLAAGLERGEACVIVTTDTSAAAVRDEIAAAVGEDLADAPVGFVDASGSAGEGVPMENRVETVGSPTDLTGVGIALSSLLEGFAGTDRPVRVGFLSLSTLLLYNDPERVLKFMHVLRGRVGAIGGLALLAVNEAAIDEKTAAQLESFLEGEIRLRETETGIEGRVRGFDGLETDWGLVAPFEHAGRAVGDGRGPSPTDPSIESIADLVDRVETERSTLTVLNYDGDVALLSDVEQYFGRLNVDVRTTDAGTETPRNVALLHRGEDFLAAAPVADLASAIAVEDDPEAEPRTMTSRLLEAVDRTVFDAEGLGRRLLVQVSHTIERLTLRTGEGRLHAGFQRLSRLADEPRTRRIYDRLADTDADVRVYGRPDVTFEDDRLTVYGSTDEEIERTWFLSYLRPDSEAGVLVAIETAEGFHGFWSYRRDLATELDAYLCATY